METTDMQLKKAIKCPDGCYVEGTSDVLADMAYRYDNDFSDENLTEIMQFSKAMSDEHSEKLMKFLLESRQEKRDGRMDQGQIKIDLLNKSCAEAIQEDDKEITFLPDYRNGKIVISIFGWDDTGSYTAAGVYTIDEFLSFEPGKLEVKIGEILSYDKNYLEE